MKNSHRKVCTRRTPQLGREFKQLKCFILNDYGIILEGEEREGGNCVVKQKWSSSIQLITIISDPKLQGFELMQRLLSSLASLLHEIQSDNSIALHCGRSCWSHPYSNHKFFVIARNYAWLCLTKRLFFDACSNYYTVFVGPFGIRRSKWSVFWGCREGRKCI